MELNITFVVQLAIFLFAMLWLSLLLFRPMLRLLEERDTRIEGTRREVARLATSGSEKAGIIEIRLDEARTEALTERKRLREEGQRIYSEAVESARKESQAKLEQARGDLESAVQAASNVLRGESDILATRIVEKVLSQPGGRS